MKHEFVETFPAHLDPDTLYISMVYGSAIHSCACGCGEKIITPFNRKKGWVLTYDGSTVSLSPSIGNWSLDCGSHYFIKKSQVKWAPLRMDDSNGKQEKRNIWRSFIKMLTS